MAKCTFFGHRDAPDEIEPILRSALARLIENKEVDCFYVGNQGGFDRMVIRVLKELRSEYPHIDYAVVLAYLPVKRNESEYCDFSDTIYPSGLEDTPPKFAISKRNLWMIERVDYVVTYVIRNFGGASQYKKTAMTKGKTVIELGTIYEP